MPRAAELIDSGTTVNQRAEGLAGAFSPEAARPRPRAPKQALSLSTLIRWLIPSPRIRRNPSAGVYLIMYVGSLVVKLPNWVWLCR